MPTKEETLIALDGSIAKWTGIVAGTETDQGPRNCPLCGLFWADDCKGCPVMDSVGYRSCMFTPYRSYIDAERTVTHLRNEGVGGVRLKHAEAGVTECAQAMLDFLKDIKAEYVQKGGD